MVSHFILFNNVVFELKLFWRLFFIIGVYVARVFFEGNYLVYLLLLPLPLLFLSLVLFSNVVFWFN